MQMLELALQHLLYDFEYGCYAWKITKQKGREAS
jgi:hypothetical protein